MLSLMIWVATLPALNTNLSSPTQNPRHEPFSEPWIDFKASPEEHTPARANQRERDANDGNRSFGRQETPTLPRPQNFSDCRDASYTEELAELDGRHFHDSEHVVQNLSTSTGKVLPPIPTEDSTQEEPPELPPRNSSDVENPPPKPPRPEKTEIEFAEASQSAKVVVSEQQQAKAKQQRSETYEIRLVNWFDSSSTVNPRRVPIMVQNANGPCPLLALVNALVLSTPYGVTTALIETLRVREQVSLGLLLDAVIDELMSGRRGNAAQNLPDVSELYGFLINLHTGMNVNPRFVNPATQPVNLMDAPNTEQATIPLESRRPGGFEDTKAMKLYSTFAISLIHGWLPRRNHPVCAALERSAKTYEDAQSLMFVEEELESKMKSGGLDEEEQRLLEDVASIKYFLNTSPTQLTDYGLDTISETLAPGAVVILFRNDHFSTLYKFPRTGQIFTLVTDTGYAGHDEVVWESLVDVSGEGSEFFSGDFRPVGNSLASPNRAASAEEMGWTTVSRNGGNGRARNVLPASGSPDSSNRAVSATNAFSSLSIDSKEPTQAPSTEQEDHDLALAMHLQEEEDDRQRQEEAARRREDELSKAFLDSQHPSGRRGGSGQSAENRPQLPLRGGGAKRAPVRKQPEPGEEAPPPSYEQAARGSPYQPVTASSPNFANTSQPQMGRPQRQSSACNQTGAAYASLLGSAGTANGSTRTGRRKNTATSPVVGRGVHPAALHGAPPAAVRRQQEDEGDKKECVVM